MSEKEGELKQSVQSESVQSEIETRKLIPKVAILLSNDWKLLAEKLDFPKNVIESINKENTTSEKKCKAVLEKVLIKDRMGLDYLKKNLHFMGREDVIEQIKEIKGILSITLKVGINCLGQIETKKWDAFNVS